jgi:uncharacterized Rmd1/YagE family protein
MRCVSFCTATNYKLVPIASFFRSKGLTVKQHRKVLHISDPKKNHNIFIFAYGCFITWGLRKNPLPQKEISRRMGQIFLARNYINLNSEYLAIPEYFWEHPSYEDYYEMVEKFLDIPSRVAALNQKLDVLHELFEMLTSQLQHRHASILEMIIILLIFIETVINLIEKI